MKAGAIDFLEKPFEGAQLLDAVRRALEQSKQLREVESVAAIAVERLTMLTPREHEVLDLLVTGRSTKAIANELGACPRTIEVHRAPDLVRLVLAAERKDIRRNPP